MRIVNLLMIGYSVNVIGDSKCGVSIEVIFVNMFLICNIISVLLLIRLAPYLHIVRKSCLLKMNLMGDFSFWVKIV